MAFDWKDGALQVDFTHEVYYQDVRGKETNSSLEEGWMFLDDLIMDLNQELAEKAKFQGYLHFRGSNDYQHQINERSVMFVEGYARLADDENPEFYEIWGGDYAEEYSTYTLNTSLLGAKAFYKPKKWMKVSALFGRNRDKSLDDYARYTAGGKVTFNYKDHLTFGATIINSEVDKNSLTGNSSIGDQTNRVYGGDMKLSLLKDSLHFEVEFARSLYHEDKRESSFRKEKDNAILVKGDISPVENLIISAAFERVEPWFHSVLGSASQDVQRFIGQIDYAPNEVFTSLTLLHEYSFNQLNSHSLEEYRTYTHTTTLTASVSPFASREDLWNSLTLDLQVDHNKNYTRDAPRTLFQDDLSANLTVSQSFDHWDYDLGYTYSRFWDRVDSANEIKSYHPTASIGGSYPWLDFDWSWNIGGGFEYRKYINTGLIDKIYSAESELSAAYAKSKSTLSLGAAIEYADNAPDPESDTPDNIGRLYSATFEQVLSDKEAFSANLTLRFSYMDYDEDTPNEAYDEIVYYLGLAMKF
jgi:hypothetical protein